MPLYWVELSQLHQLVSYLIVRDWCTATAAPLWSLPAVTAADTFTTFMVSRPGRFLGLAGLAIRPLGRDWAGPGRVLGQTHLYSSLYKRKSSAIAEKQRVSCACLSKLAIWSTDL